MSRPWVGHLMISPESTTLIRPYAVLQYSLDANTGCYCAGTSRTPPLDMASSITTSVLRAITTQEAILPRQVITQTITNDDYTSTAVVTLGPGDPSSVPLAPSSDPPGSSGLSSTDIGIIIGSIAGAIVLGLVIWLCCYARRRMEEDYYEYENDSQMATYDIMQPPQRTYWPRFPASIPPPDVPTYVAVPPRRTYTANGAGRRPTVSYVY
ncbi:hypothetical protein F5Y01DRAFT_320703 [Xylaria sp. FL0043]|nr:hypothetical protein F5Y01DRAFT_320703 [Xylaria sp. FL0043]